MAPSKAAEDLLQLKASIPSITTLVNGFYSALRSPTPPPPKMESPPQPLALMSDSCKILKAQTTKLSLLVLNKPFTPTEITFILSACSGGCLPAMMSAMELCPAESYTQLLHNHMKSSLSTIMVELLNLLASIPQDEHGVDPQNRGTLASTGVLWAECDQIVKIASDGLVALAMQKAEQYHDLLKDAIAELEDWDPAEINPDSDTESLPSTKQKPITNGAVVAKEVPPIDRDVDDGSVSSMVELRKCCLTTLRTVRLLYPALKKRRISTFPNIISTTGFESLPPATTMEDLDSMMFSARSFTEMGDEIAGALYEGDEMQVSMRLKSLQDKATACAIRAKKNWKGEEDEFSGWVDKWVTRLEEVEEG